MKKTIEVNFFIETDEKGLQDDMIKDFINNIKAGVFQREWEADLTKRKVNNKVKVIVRIH